MTTVETKSAVHAGRRGRILFLATSASLPVVLALFAISIRYKIVVFLILLGANSLFCLAENKAWIERSPGIELNYGEKYPELLALERHYETIRKEMQDILQSPKQSTALKPFDTIQRTESDPSRRYWKTFVLNFGGKFIEENKQHAPKTMALLQQHVPDSQMALFSLLDAHSTTLPHWGQYKGFRRYHMAIIVPDDNRNKNMYFQINPDAEMNNNSDQYKQEAVRAGAKHYWKEGQGFLFDDTFLHSGTNDSDHLRVVLMIDVPRKDLPLLLHWFNRVCTWWAQQNVLILEKRKASIVTY